MKYIGRGDNMISPASGRSIRYPADESDCFNYGINGMCGPECPAYGEAGRDCKDEAALEFEEEESGGRP
jgi:hypothetical protein